MRVRVCGSKRLSCNAGYQEVRDESEEFIAFGEEAQARDPLWLWNPGRHYQKSKTVVSVASQKEWCPQNLKKWKNDSYYCVIQKVATRVFK